MRKNAHTLIYFSASLQHLHYLFQKAVYSHLLKLNHSDLQKPSADLSETVTAIFGVAQ